jgi:NADH:ubiquinone oxidoreductase subunit C
MSTLETTPAAPVNALAAIGQYFEKGGVFWYNQPGIDIREVARAMNSVGARFITITAYQLPGTEGFRFEYHWDLAGHLLGFNFPLAGNAIDSIFDLCEAADWIEREVHEEYRIDFTGREYEPLLLREGSICGVNLREVGVPDKPASSLVSREEVAK